MECNIIKQAVIVNDVAFDGLAEQSLECDIILPDYCPDIVKILKCELLCAVPEAKASGDRLELSGVGTATVLYMSDDNPAGLMEVRSIDYKLPYVKNCELKGQAVNPIIDLNVKTDYVNCRAVSKRRIEVRGAVSHKIRVVNTAEQQVVTSAQGMGVQLKKNILDMTACVVQSHSNLSIKEELEIGSGKPAIACVITSRCVALLTDYKVISGKIVTKGELRITVLYYSSGDSDSDLNANSNNSSKANKANKSSKSKIETMEYSLPISQIIDADGADDDCICNVQYQVSSCDIQPKADLDGEMRVLTVDAEILIKATTHRKTRTILATDCYCTSHESNFQSSQVNLMTLVNTVHDTHMHKGCVQLPENIKSVLNGWCRITDQSVKIEKGQISVIFKLNICLIAVDCDGAIEFYEKTDEVTHKIFIPEDCEQIIFLPNITPISMAYSIGGAGNLSTSSELEARCEILISGSIYCMLRRNAICDVVLEESKPKLRDKNCALTIYYADKGESLWDIAKHYHTAIDAVLQENSFDSNNLDNLDILEDRTMLLIPLI